MMTHVILALLAMGIASCGVTATSTSSFKVRMHGIYSPPTGATGDSTPRSQTYLFNAATLTKADGTAVPLYSGDPQSLKIIDRGQIVYANTDMSTYDGTAFSSVLVQFDPTVVVTSKGGKDSLITLSSGDLQLDEAFDVVKQKERVLTIKIAWGDTITVNDDGSETVTAPTFTMKYEDGD